jgi:hypothetical protein
MLTQGSMVDRLVCIEEVRGEVLSDGAGGEVLLV